MAIAHFASSSETYNNLSKLVQQVKNENLLIFITLHGKPCYALTPVEPEPTADMEALGIRDLAQDFSKILKRLKSSGDVLITSRGKPIAQLIAIESDEVDDMILAHGRGLQETAAKLQNPEVASQLPSTDSLLTQLYALRNKVSA